MQMDWNVQSSNWRPKLLDHGNCNKLMKFDLLKIITNCVLKRIIKKKIVYISNSQWNDMIFSFKRK